jgi:cytochrome P450
MVRGNINKDLVAMHSKHGLILRIGPNEVTFAHPDAWNDVFRPAGRQPFSKDPTWWKNLPGTPLSIITAVDPEDSAYIRKCFAPAFSSRAFRLQEPILHRYASLLTSRLRETVESGQDEVDMFRWFNFYTFDCFGDLAFGESFQCLERGTFHEWVARLFQFGKLLGAIGIVRLYPNLTAFLLKLIPKSLITAQEGHNQLMRDKVQRRLERGFDGPDLMSEIAIQGFNTDEGGKGLPVEVVASSLAFLAVAGSEPLAVTLGGAMNYLLHNPEKLGILQHEIRQRFTSGEEITVEASKELPYLTAVLNEALRLCPGVRWIPPRRVPEGGAVICGSWLPGGTPVSFSNSAMNREPSSWHDAKGFHPERWLPKAAANPKSPFYGDKRHAAQPFMLLAPTSCMGHQIAWAEMRLGLARFLWTFDVALPDKEKWVRWEDLRTFMLIEKKPIMVRLKVRAT